ncbi:EcsC family protein [Paracoccus marcusii]|uniref:EcsC family protein n=1 Tax=Paracoccus marcusii TaxID=59779 RepID=UPI002ED3627B|nr:EcsC family protein [Paracoccus marcusii]
MVQPHGLDRQRGGGRVGGFAGALVELPFTVTLLLRAMLDIAAEHGLDPESEEVRLECLRIFAAAGPMADDDQTDLGMLAARLSVTGQTVQSMVSKVAPRLSVSLGQKMAAQAAPVFGAVVGASINYTFARYYQELARVHFGVMRLSHETGIPQEALTEALRLSIQRQTPRPIIALTAGAGAAASRRRGTQSRLLGVQCQGRGRGH